VWGGGGSHPEGRIPAGEAPPSEILLAGRKQGREGIREMYPSGYSQQGTDKGGKPPRDVSQRVQHPQRDTESRTQGKDGKPPRGVPKRAQHPQACTASRTQARTGRPPRGVSQRALHPQRTLLSGRRGGQEGLQVGYTSIPRTPSGIQRAGHRQGTGKDGKPPRNVSQRVLLDVHFRGCVLGLQNGVVRVLCITR